MNRVTVVSVPHTGTHIAVHMASKIPNVDVKFTHVGPSGNQYEIAKAVFQSSRFTIDGGNHIIVVPRRLPQTVADSWENRKQDVSELLTCYERLTRLEIAFPNVNIVEYNVSNGERGTIDFLEAMKKKLPKFREWKVDDVLRQWVWASDSNIGPLALGDPEEAKNWVEGKMSQTKWRVDVTGCLDDSYDIEAVDEDDARSIAEFKFEGEHGSVMWSAVNADYVERITGEDDGT
jgi:hypothetical protein